MFNKILIANRSEIACRIIRTARDMGVRCVAVYSDADVDAQHVAMADEAVHIGPPAVADSYLQGDRIIAAALKTGAQAIHPGYGFLSENPEFVDAVTAAGLVFIGPSADAIRAMGLKDAAKALMIDAGVPVVPGYHGADQDPAMLAREADKIGYPVMIKARAGGGGKGMRLVEDADGFTDALEAAQREGQASFGDPVCLIEKFIQHPRHIEIQVFGDTHGHVVHMFERDCSLQRRHQKVIEEAPAPGMTDDVRKAMGDAAVQAAKAVSYAGAGTVEFIVDGSGPLRTDGFWFMEMNTRLQVEHPVSEAITGLDFVALQLRVAAGEPLPFAQSDLSIKGHAFEARVYAEDPTKSFLPATGTLSHFTVPPAPTRTDSGVRAGDTISPWYDPMIAKVITHGATRDVALAQMTNALAATQIAGTVTNLAFLHRLSQDTDFAAGRVDTGLIARGLERLTSATHASDVTRLTAALCALNPAQAGRAKGWRQWGHAHYFCTLDETLIEIMDLGGDRYRFNGQDYRVTRTGQSGFQFNAETLTRTLNAVRHDDRVTVFEDGATHVFTIPDPLDVAGGADAGGDTVIAPMPGLVKLISARAGQTVAQGDPVMVLEAMKMEHVLRAPRDGTVAEVLVTQDAQVSDGTIMLRFEPADD